MTWEQIERVIQGELSLSVDHHFEYSQEPEAPVCFADMPASRVRRSLRHYFLLDKRIRRMNAPMHDSWKAHRATQWRAT